MRPYTLPKFSAFSLFTFSLLLTLTALPIAANAGEAPGTDCTFADDILKNCDQQATVLIEGMANSLEGAYGGAQTINGYLSSYKQASLGWKPNTFLVSMNFLSDPGSSDLHEFTWASTRDKTHVFKISTGNNSREETIETPVKYGIHKVPMRLRDLVKAMREDPELLPLLNDLYKNKHLYSANFHLAKNSTNRLTWVVTFFTRINWRENAWPTFGGEVYSVVVSAETKENPVFTVLHKI